LTLMNVDVSIDLSHSPASRGLDDFLSLPFGLGSLSNENELEN
jgi:hypothetical protein